MGNTEYKRQFRQLWNRMTPHQRRETSLELEKMLKLSESKKKSISAFHQAVKSGNTEAVKNILASGVDVNAKDPQLGNTALIYAALNGDIKMVELLLEKGANPNVQNQKGKTAFDAAKTSIIMNLLKT